MPSSVGEVLLACAQDVPDSVERVVLAAAVTVDVLLDPAVGLVDDLRGELDDVERVKDRPASWSSSSMAFLYPWNGSKVAI